MGELLYNIYIRRIHEVNTDPMKRCYDGHHFKSELRWSNWELLNYDVPADKIDSKLKFWRELNEYAVSQRGDSAKCEYKAEVTDPCHKSSFAE